jgi:GNAT superfamily N-acetyltransferase
MIPRVYTWILADNETHKKTETLADIPNNYPNPTLGLYCNGKAIGTGRLCMKDRAKKHVNTSGTEIFKRYRNKGHGIELYKALIAEAKRLGAIRIYSDDSLNKFSRRMWKTKLSRVGFKVKSIGGCKNPCSHCRASERFYIDL